MKCVQYLAILLLAQSSLVMAAEPAPPTATVKKLNLEDSIRMALKGASSVLKANRDSEVSGSQLLQSYLQFLPNLTAQGAYNKTSGTTYLYQGAPTLVQGNNYGPSYQISTTFNIFNGLSDLSAFKASLDRRDAAEKTLMRAQQQISLDIAQAYLQVILDIKLVAIAEKNLKTSQERQILLEEQTKVGVRNLADLFRQQAQTSADESFAITTENQRKKDMILLLQKLRIHPDEEYELVEPPLEESIKAVDSEKALDSAELIRTALDIRADYNVAKLNTEAAKWDVTNARGSFLPRLDFVATYGAAARHLNSQIVGGLGDVTPLSQNGFNYQLEHQADTTYGLVLTWNIFDRWVTAYNVDQARSKAFKADVDQEDFHNQVIGDVKQAINDYNAAIQQLHTSEKGVNAARKAYEVSQGRYDVGSLNFIDLSTAQVNLVQAEAARAQSLIGYALQKRALDFAIGRTPVQ
jgi:outer membrane protein